MRLKFFGSGWARYDLAQPGTFRLVPRSVQLQHLQWMLSVREGHGDLCLLAVRFKRGVDHF